MKLLSIIIAAVFICTLIDAKKSVALPHNHEGKTRIPSEGEQLDYIGCPANNDFYYHGTINSPLYPRNYPPNDKCYYFITAEPGKILKFTFSHYDLETCCDYVTIYDGPTENSKKLVQIGGPKSDVTTPAAAYYTTTRNALVEFSSNEVIQRSGFSMQYTSTDSAKPCNRDILLVINGMAVVGNQNNFKKQLDFIANKLTPTWQVNANKVRTMINFQTDIDYAVVWSADDLPTNADVTKEVLGLTDFVPDVKDNNNTDLECLFRYSYDSFGSFGQKNFDERYGIEQVAIVFVAANSNDDQDFYEAMEFSHKARTEYDVKTIVVGMGSNLDQARLSQLAYAQGFAFFATYDNLASLVPQINNAICAGLSAQCGP